jgi:hypothetical protein
MHKLVAIFVLLSNVAFSAPSKHTTSPTEAFGFQPGADRKLADWKELTAYFQELGSESNRVRYEEVGQTTEGRPFTTVTISSPETIAHLGRYKEILRRLADPRITSPEQAKQLVADGKTVLVVTCNVHSTEIASSQSATEFVYRLHSTTAARRTQIISGTPGTTPSASTAAEHTVCA